MLGPGRGFGEEERKPTQMDRKESEMHKLSISLDSAFSGWTWRTGPGWQLGPLTWENKGVNTAERQLVEREEEKGEEKEGEEGREGDRERMKKKGKSLDCFPPPPTPCWPLLSSPKSNPGGRPP